MSINFKDLNLKTDTSTKTFKFGDKEIEVFNTLSARDKYDLIMITLQKAETEEGTYNEFLLDVFFHVNLVIMYTNIIFEEEDKEDVFFLFDKLTQSGFLTNFMMTINEDEYTSLLNCLNAIRKTNEHYKTTTAAIISKLVDDLPKNAEIASDFIDNFDPDKFESLRTFANDAGLSNNK